MIVTAEYLQPAVSPMTAIVQQIEQKPNKLKYLKNYYPAKYRNAPISSIVDKYGMYNRQCTSYAAFKVDQIWHYRILYWGNAKLWPFYAKKAGVKSSTTPRTHSVAISKKGIYGHAMFVERISGDRKRMRISEYNGAKKGGYSHRIISTKNLTYIYFKR